MPWYDFEDLLDFMEDMIIHVYKAALDIPMLQTFNKNVVLPKKPFERVSYEKAIELLREYKIQGEEGKFLEYGDDITEGPERALVDKIGKPTYLT